MSTKVCFAAVFAAPLAALPATTLPTVPAAAVARAAVVVTGSSFRIATRPLIALPCVVMSLS